jgi:hypothetical protein
VCQTSSRRANARAFKEQEEDGGKPAQPGDMSLQLAGAAEMVVFVRSPSNAVWELLLCPTATVGAVKEKLCRMTPWPAWKQDLWLGNLKLEDERTLADCGVVAEATLRLSQRFDLRREAEIELRMPIMSHVCCALMLPEDFAVELYLSGFTCDTCIPFMCVHAGTCV